MTVERTGGKCQFRKRDFKPTWREMRVNLCFTLLMICFICINMVACGARDEKREMKVDKEKTKREKEYWEEFTEEEWEDEEKRLLWEVEQIEKDERLNKDYLPKLHQLGRAMYRRENWAGALDVAERIAVWNAKVHGTNSVQFAMALGNVGSAAHNLGQTDLVEASMNRAYRIISKEFGKNSREETQVFAKLVSYKLCENQDSPKGWSQKKYEAAMMKIHGVESDEGEEE